MTASGIIRWKVGDPIEIGRVNDTTFEIDKWELATVSHTYPLTAVLSDGTEEKLPLNRPRRKPAVEVDNKPNLPTAVERQIFHKALVEIVKEGDTDHPNATVKRIVKLAKIALGELSD